MKILYYIYQICIALPILLVLTILTAIVTIVGSLVGGAHFWGYYPGKIWSQLILSLIHIYSPSVYIYPEWGGMYLEGTRGLYVNVGIGYVGLPFRFGAWPEITVLTLRR